MAKKNVADKRGLSKPEAEFVGDVKKCFMAGKPEDGRSIFEISIDLEKMQKFGESIPGYAFARTVHGAKGAVLEALGVTVERVAIGKVSDAYRAELRRMEAEIDEVFEEPSGDQPAMVDASEGPDAGEESDATE